MMNRALEGTRITSYPVAPEEVIGTDLFNRRSDTSYLDFAKAVGTREEP